MASRWEIEMDFRRAMAEAKKLDEAAGSLDKLSRKRLSETLQTISVNWKGESASLYTKKGAALQGRMNTTASELHKIAEDIRTIARRIYEAEMKNVEVAKN